MFNFRLSALLLVALLLGLTVSSNAQLGSSSAAGLSGTVVADDSKPMEGVAVSARADDKTYTTTVYTDPQGHYTFSGLPDGHYKVWAQAVGFEAGQFEQAVSGTAKGKHDFTLKTSNDVSTQIGGDEMLASLPSDSPDDLRMREIFARNCTGCHQAIFPLQNRFDVKGWTAIINFMERTDPFAEVRDPNRVSPVIDAYKQELAAYLAKVRGPSSAPLKYQLVPRPSGEAGQVVITEFDLPFDLPPGDTRDSLAANRGNLWSNGEPSDHMPPHDARVDQRGVVWFTDQI